MVAATNEANARRIWGELGIDLSRHTRVGKLIACTDALARAVQALLSEQGTETTVGAALSDPADIEAGRVICLELTWPGHPEAAIPLPPAPREVHVWSGRHGGHHQRIVDLDHQVATVPLPHESADEDGWVPAAAIAAAIIESRSRAA